MRQFYRAYPPVRNPSRRLATRIGPPRFQFARQRLAKRDLAESGLQWSEQVKWASTDSLIFAACQKRLNLTRLHIEEGVLLESIHVWH